MMGVLSGRNREWAAQAPVLILAAARVRLTRNGEPNAFAHYDLGHAVGNMTVQAVAQGLQLHQMGGFDRDAAREAFHVPPDHQPVAVIALGYPAEEQPPRPRLPLASFVFEGEWGKHAPFLEKDSNNTHYSITKRRSHP